MASNTATHFVLFPTCNIVSGACRNILIDYAHDTTYFISDDYKELLLLLKENTIEEVRSLMEDNASVQYFEEFLLFMQSHSMGIVCSDKDRFPELSDDLNDEHINLIDCIIEFDESTDEELLKCICDNLEATRCSQIQIRQKQTNLQLVRMFLDMLSLKGINYVELHIVHTDKVGLSDIEEIISEYAYMRQVFLYNYTETKTMNVMTVLDEYVPLSLGCIHLLKDSFDDGLCCGQICIENLDFSGRWVNSMLSQKNGCLYKKAFINKNGDVTNCPSMTKVFGNIQETSLCDIIKSSAFTKYWEITKDNIQICRDCEFRYNCTDCRAFIEDPLNIYSKPIKCSYNPYLGKW